ncbi:OB-fold-containig protein [Endobacterium cereale]|uniref:OB-fold-containig protein n=1 Tax=Endobacterium cereale TaxID=2663029 RepID=UPI002B481B63|nr:OB-fold-containig protein [Endobacterium cereale]MEB2844106.1 OB-fold-containig protein [Endobacterium cereale]
MDLFLAPQAAPFAVASIILVTITVLEMGCLLIGVSLSELVDKAMPEGQGGGLSGLMSWVNRGGVPVLVLVMLLLGFFAVNGFVLQAVARAVFMPLPAVLASIPAFVVAVPQARWATGLISRIIPRDETYVIDPADFVGRLAEVTVGPLDQGLPGRVRIKDRHGNWHTLRARAAADATAIPIGAEVLLVDTVSNVFIAIAAPSDLTAEPNPTSTELP